MDKYGWKKIGLVLVGASLIIIIISLFSNGSIDQKSLDAAKKAVTDRFRGIERQGSYQTIYTNDYYSISLPQEFDVNEFIAPVNALDSVKISDGDSFVMNIEGYPFSRSILSELTGPFDSLKYTKSDDLLPLGPATSYIGEINGEDKLFEKVVVVRKNDLVIRLILSNFGGKNDDNVVIFDRMVTSLR